MEDIVIKFRRAPCELADIEKSLCGILITVAGHDQAMAICGSRYSPVRPATAEYSHINTFCFHPSACYTG